MKSTKYFQATRMRPDRSQIKDEWIQQVVQFPEKEQMQADGRIRRWAKIEDMEGRYLRVILLPQNTGQIPVFSNIAFSFIYITVGR
ncbi:MAG TPA: hypothetical protein VIQ81_00615 [Gammaproteobacteria bacterium]